MIQFEALFLEKHFVGKCRSGFVENREWPTGWYIARQYSEAKRQGLRKRRCYLSLSKSHDVRPLAFASQEDCNAAIAALHRAGVTRDLKTWLETPMEERRRIACEALPW